MNKTHVSEGAAKTPGQAKFIANGFDILKIVDEYPGGDWYGETGDIELTERIVELLNALEGIANPAVVKQLVMQARRIQNSINEAAPSDLRVVFESADLINFKAALAALDAPVPKTEDLGLR